MREYLVCVVRLLVEVPLLRKHVRWFCTPPPNRTPKFMHWEIGFEGDGFPPGSFEMLLHVFNVGRLCEHEDFNFTLMAGQVEEKSSLCKVLIHLLDQQYEEVRTKGLDVTFDVEGAKFVRGVTHEFINKDGTTHNTFDDTAKGDMSYIALSSGNGTCASNRPEWSRRFD